MRAWVVVACLLSLNVDQGLAAHSQMSPVSRVVELLKGLSVKIEEEGKAEEDLYETFVCWGTSSIDQYTAANEKHATTIAGLEAHLEDIDAGRVEFTKERENLEAEIAENTARLEEAQAINKQEIKDYELAKKDFEDSIDALTQAKKVLQEEGGVELLAVDSSLGFSDRVAQASMLNKAVAIGEQYLARGDALFLRRVLTGEVRQPKNKDWKKLNKKGEYNAKYKARSGKILELIDNLKKTAERNLKAAIAKEKKRVADFEKTETGLKEELKEDKKALEDMSAETAAAGGSREETEAERDNLAQQVEDNTKFINQIKEQLKEKKAEWKLRQEARAIELKGIAKAISILHSDDARDTFKQSFDSQGYLFLETSNSALDALKAAAKVAESEKIGALVKNMEDTCTASNTKACFEMIVGKINKMLDDLQEEQDKDLETKEECETELQENSHDAVIAARNMDENTEEIDFQKNKIAEAEQVVKEANADIKQNRKDLAAAEKQRAAEKKAHAKTDADDKQASHLVDEARKVLVKMSADVDNVGMSLVQKPKIVSGKAPPPPPSTWEDPNYGGKDDEQTGIVAILEMIKEDIDRDRTQAQEAEDAAQKEFDELKKELNKQHDTLNKLVKTKKQEITDAKKVMEDETGERKEEHVKVQESVAAYHENFAQCHFFMANFRLRTANRQEEMDGLKKARAILNSKANLQDGKFDHKDFDHDDPNREIKPGDA